MGRDVLVVGGGVIGLTTALALADRGARVTLLDQGTLPHPDASSTDISKLIRADYGTDVFYSALMEEALLMWRRLAEEEDGLFFETGMLVLSSRALSPGSFEGDSFALLRKRGHPLERLDENGIYDRAPAFRRGAYVDGYFNPRGGYADSGRVVSHLVTKARSVGIEILENRGIVPLTERPGPIEGIALTDGQLLSAERYVIAAGAWTPHLLPELADRMRPVAQAVLHFQPADPKLFSLPRFFPWAADIQTTGWYGFPVHAGVLKLANHGPGAFVDARATRTVDPNSEARFRDFLSRSLPAAAEAPLARKRVCLYCDTFDGDFFVDCHPERPQLVVASGGSGHAFKFAPLLGRLAADRVSHGPAASDDRFRFRGRAAPRAEEARHRGSPSGGA